MSIDKARTWVGDQAEQSSLDPPASFPIFVSAAWEQAIAFSDHLCSYTDLLVICTLPLGAGLTAYLQALANTPHPSLHKVLINTAYLESHPSIPLGTVWIVDDADQWSNEALGTLLQYAFERGIHLVFGTHSDLSRRLDVGIHCGDRYITRHYLRIAPLTPEDSQLFFSRWTAFTGATLPWDPLYFDQTGGWPGRLSQHIQRLCSEPQDARRSIGPHRPWYTQPSMVFEQPQGWLALFLLLFASGFLLYQGWNAYLHKAAAPPESLFYSLMPLEPEWGKTLGLEPPMFPIIVDPLDLEPERLESLEAGDQGAGLGWSAVFSPGVAEFLAWFAAESALNNTDFTVSPPWPSTSEPWVFTGAGLAESEEEPGSF